MHEHAVSYIDKLGSHDGDMRKVQAAQLLYLPLYIHLSLVYQTHFLGIES